MAATCASSASKREQRRSCSPAYSVKRAAGQINVLIHAVAGVLLLPKIMEPGERVQYVSWAPATPGRSFDLETDRRVAEFKFIHWRGGADTIGRISLFKDFYLLAEIDAKRKELYVLDLNTPLKFLRGGRSLRAYSARASCFGTSFGRARRQICDRPRLLRAKQHDVSLRDALRSARTPRDRGRRALGTATRTSTEPTNRPTTDPLRPPALSLAQLVPRYSPLLTRAALRPAF